MKVQQRELWLVPFPFSDFSGRKVRPVLIISNDEFNTSSEDSIVCGTTSNITQKYHLVQLNKEDLEEGHLFDPCGVKVENILKINNKLLLKKIGKVKERVLNESIVKLNTLFK